MQGKVRTTLVTVRKQGIKFGCPAVHVGFNVILHICQCKWDSKILENAMGCLFCGQNGSFLSVLGCYLCIWDVSWLNVRTVHIVRDTMVKNACLHTDAGQKWVTIVMFPLHLGEVPLCLVTSCISSHFCHIPFYCNLLPNLENTLVVARWYAMKTTSQNDTPSSHVSSDWIRKKIACWGSLFLGCHNCSSVLTMILCPIWHAAHCVASMRSLTSLTLL